MQSDKIEYEETNVFKRMVYLHLQWLSMCEIPIYALKPNSDGKIKYRSSPTI